MPKYPIGREWEKARGQPTENVNAREKSRSFFVNALEKVAHGARFKDFFCAWNA